MAYTPMHRSIEGYSIGMSSLPRPRRILHLDMDAFFASVELLRRPQLRGQPVVIGGRFDPREDPRTRGVVSTATYEARAFGVRSGMSLREALRRCPQVHFLPVDFSAYTPVSAQFKQIMRDYSPLLEDRGIDEAYLDITLHPLPSLALARALKQAILDRTGLTCSIGIAPNKLLAKISSELDKPDGITLLDAGDVPLRIWPMPVRTLPGVGPKTDQVLRAHAISTVAHLAAVPLGQLSAMLGTAHAAWLHAAAHGEDDRPLATEREPRSRSTERTFAEDVSEKREVARRLGVLCVDLAAELTAEGLVGRTVGIKLRFSDFVTQTRDMTFSGWTADPRALRRAAFDCLHRIDMNRSVRLVGVRVSDLRRSSTRDSGEDIHPRLDFGP